MPRPSLTMLLDGDCGFCRRGGAWVSRWDREGRIEQLPLQDPSVPARFPQLSRDALEEALHVVDTHGRSWRGAAACGQVVRVLPGGALVAWLFRLPGAEWAYAQVARRRSRSCTVPTRGHASPW